MQEQGKRYKLANSIVNTAQLKLCSSGLLLYCKQLCHLVFSQVSRLEEDINRLRTELSGMKEASSLQVHTLEEQIEEKNRQIHRLEGRLETKADQMDKLA